ncbi:MAG: LemA family protein [Thermoleophilaceae bacterium]|nr:LemA family protein [Thermoleophilaceae bacterium]
MSPLLIVVCVLIVLAGFLLGLYNAMVRARNLVDESWSGVDVQLKRRRDLIPNLVATVKAYAAHEAETLQIVTEARVVAETAAQASTIQAANAENRVTQSLRGLFAVTENYPALKADQNFLQLQLQLVDIENQVAGARAIFNGNARAYNDRIQSIPASFFAPSLGFKPRPYVEAAARERSSVGVGI